MDKKDLYKDIGKLVIKVLEIIGLIAFLVFMILNVL